MSHREPWSKLEWFAFLTAFVFGLVLFGAIFFGCAATPHAALRREAESRLRGCVGAHRCMQDRECIAESVAWCQANGMEKTCGTDGAFTQPVTCAF
jgi:hypothetical protein